jgi:hypothetical protein
MDDPYPNLDPRTDLRWINKYNGAAEICYELHKQIMKEFKGVLYAAILGSAYGGECEALGHLWKGRGYVWGFDVFEDLHPDHLAKQHDSFEARCMDHWYKPNIFGTEHMAYDYQRGVLDAHGLDNVTLVKGEVNKDSCREIPRLHYVLMDMDIIESMMNGYEAVKDKVVKGGYLCLHDVLPPPHLDGHIYNWWYNHQLGSGEWEIYAEHPKCHLGIYKRI